MHNIAARWVRKSTNIHRHPRVAELGGDRVRRTRLQTAAPPAIHLPKYPPSPQCLPLTARTTNKEETDGRLVLYMLSLYLVYPLVGRHCVLPYTSSFVSFIVHAVSVNVFCTTKLRDVWCNNNNNQNLHLLTKHRKHGAWRRDAPSTGKPKYRGTLLITWYTVSTAYILRGSRTARDV